jgi:hypothetical protein
MVVGPSTSTQSWRNAANEYILQIKTEIHKVMNIININLNLNLNIYI